MVALMAHYSVPVIAGTLVHDQLELGIRILGSFHNLEDLFIHQRSALLVTNNGALLALLEIDGCPVAVLCVYLHWNPEKVPPSDLLSSPLNKFAGA